MKSQLQLVTRLLADAKGSRDRPGCLALTPSNLMRLSQAADHPVALNFPEGEYLKGLVVEVG